MTVTKTCHEKWVFWGLIIQKKIPRRVKNYEKKIKSLASKQTNGNDEVLVPCSISNCILVKMSNPGQ